MSYAPSGAIPTVYTTPDRGERRNPPPDKRGDPAGWESPMDSRATLHGRVGLPGPQTMAGLARMGLPKGDEPLLSKLSPELPEAEESGGVQMKPLPCLYHRIQPRLSWQVRENQKEHCEVSRDANKSTWAPQPNFFQICSITSV